VLKSRLIASGVVAPVLLRSTLIVAPLDATSCPLLSNVSVPLPSVRDVSLSSPLEAKNRQVVPVSDLPSSTAVTSTLSGVPSES
jgi:hypothetical protein